jgi:hypothetical protein
MPLQTYDSVKPVEKGMGSPYERAIIMGVYGDWWPLRADRIIEMPAELIDCNTKDE